MTLRIQILQCEAEKNNKILHNPKGSLTLVIAQHLET